MDDKVISGMEVTDDDGLDEKIAILDERAKQGGIPKHLKPSTLLTDAERKVILDGLKINETPELDFEFVKIINGLRKKENTIVMAPIGRGKSTLSKTIINTACEAGKKVFVILSEDKPDQYLTMCGLDYKYKDNLYVISEKLQLKNIAKSKHTHEEKITKLGVFILFLLKNLDFKPDYIIFDNVHTSKFYNSSNSYDIFDFFDCFEEISERHNCSNIFFAHVATTSREKVPLDPEDIKGFKDINVKAHHTAALYMAGLDRAKGETPRLCLHWCKSRTQPQSTGTKFSLYFDEKKSLYSSDKRIDNNTFEHFWKPKKGRKTTDEVEATRQMDELTKEATKRLSQTRKDMLKMDLENFV